MTQVFNAGVAVREDRGDDTADEFLEGVASAEPKRNQVIAIDRSRERRRVTRRGAGVFESGQESAVDRPWRVEGGEYLLLGEESLIYIYISTSFFPPSFSTGL